MTTLMERFATAEGQTETRKVTERRRGLRVRQSRPVKVFDCVEGKALVGRTEDISATGLRIELPASAAGLCPGQELTIHVGPSASGRALPNRKHMSRSRVVWAELDWANGTVTAGLELIASIAAEARAA